MGDERGQASTEWIAVVLCVALVLGHPDYYPRFGFDPAVAYGVECPYEGIPSEAWMAQPLTAYEPGIRGIVAYAAPFGALTT